MTSEGTPTASESVAPLPPNALTPDGRFAFDGEQWRAVPLPPEVATRRRRIPTAIVWLLVVVAAIVGGAIIFYVVVGLGLSATRP